MIKRIGLAGLGATIGAGVDFRNVVPDLDTPLSVAERKKTFLEYNIGRDDSFSLRHPMISGAMSLGIAPHVAHNILQSKLKQNIVERRRNTGGVVTTNNIGGNMVKVSNALTRLISNHPMATTKIVALATLGGTLGKMVDSSSKPENIQKHAPSTVTLSEKEKKGLVEGRERVLKESFALRHPILTGAATLGLAPAIASKALNLEVLRNSVTPEHLREFQKRQPNLMGASY